jgi:hypothetical protein
VDVLERAEFEVKTFGNPSKESGLKLIAEVTRLRQLLSEAEKRERELVAMINSSDESLLVQIRRAEAAEERENEARNVALDDAANIVAAVSHEGLHKSMWRCRFERVAADIRALKSEER